MKFKKHKVFTQKQPLNEIFISRKRKNPEKFYSERAYELFNSTNSSYKEVYICGLGACTSIAVSASLNLIDISTNLKIEGIETETVEQVDDYVDSINEVNTFIFISL